MILRHIFAMISRHCRASSLLFFAEGHYMIITSLPAPRRHADIASDRAEFRRMRRHAD